MGIILTRKRLPEKYLWFRTSYSGIIISSESRIITWMKGIILKIHICVDGMVTNTYQNFLSNVGNPDTLICGNCRECFLELGELLDHKRSYCKLRFTCKCQESFVNSSEYFLFKWCASIAKEIIGGNLIWKEVKYFAFSPMGVFLFYWIIKRRIICSLFRCTRKSVSIINQTFVCRMQRRLFQSMGFDGTFTGCTHDQHLRIRQREHKQQYHIKEWQRR